jgi:hypothetical protein
MRGIACGRCEIGGGDDVGRRQEPTSPTVELAVTSAMRPYLDVLKHRLPGQDFTEQEESAVIALLAQLDGNISRTSTLTGMSTGTLWTIKERNMGALTEARERWKRHFTMRLQDITAQLTDKVSHAIESQPLSVRDGMVSLGIAIDKAAMLAGEGLTVNHRHTHEASPEMMELLSERIRAVRPVDDVAEADFRVVDE